MELASIRVITDDVDRMVAFYEALTGVASTPRALGFVEIRTPLGTLAVADSSTVATLGGAMVPRRNDSVIIEFRVDDEESVDAAHAAARATGAEVVLPPTTMPWGNRSTLVRDPDGSLVNVFALPS